MRSECSGCGPTENCSSVLMVGSSRNSVPKSIDMQRTCTRTAHHRLKSISSPPLGAHAPQPQTAVAGILLRVRGAWHHVLHLRRDVGEVSRPARLADGVRIVSNLEEKLSVLVVI